MSKRKHVIANSTHCAALGLILMAAGAYLLYDAYEGRGRERPFGLRFLIPSG